jgi:hypothetical protein
VAVSNTLGEGTSVLREAFYPTMITSTLSSVLSPLLSRVMRTRGETLDSHSSSLNAVSLIFLDGTALEYLERVVDSVSAKPGVGWTERSIEIGEQVKKLL